MESSFLNENTTTIFKIDTDKFYSIDYLTLEHADKYCLHNQNFNLNYLVWHTIINQEVTNDKINGDESNQVLPYCKFVYVFVVF